MLKRLACVLAVNLAYTSFAADNGGLKTSVAVDLLGEFSHASQKGLIDYQAKDSFKLRSAEFSFFAPVDPSFDGLLTFAAHPEGDQAFGVPEVHEAYLSSHKLVDGLSIKAGQFFLGVGRINQKHQHDWPFITATLLQKELFNSEEGVIDTGLEASYLLPTDFYLRITAGVTNGNDFGHSHVEDEKPLTPTHYVRASSFASLFGLENQLAVNYLGRTSAVNETMRLWGVDLISKRKKYGRTQSLLQSEIWKRQLEIKGRIDSKVGGYIYLQHVISSVSDLHLGLRYDRVQIASNRKNYMQAGEISITKHTSEFTKLVLGYSLTRKYYAVRESEKTDKWLLQMSYILGSHPSHEF